MKSCIYLTRNKTNGKWYIGSHKDSDNIRNRKYMGSGTSISPELEANPDNFTCEVLYEFDNRNDAFKGEHQILHKLDAAGDENSYNNTNNSWPKEGFFKNIFGSKIGPLNSVDLQDVVNKINEEEDKKEDNTKSSGLTMTVAFIEYLNTGAEKMYEYGLSDGYKFGCNDGAVDKLNDVKERLIHFIEKELLYRHKDLFDLKETLETSNGVLTIKSKIQSIEKEIEYFDKKLKEVEDEKGWYTMFKTKINEGYKDGVLEHCNKFLNSNALI